MREESQRLQAAIDAIRHAYVTQMPAKNGPKGPCEAYCGPHGPPVEYKETDGENSLHQSCFTLRFNAV
jgi:hypothetical protein